MFRMRKQRLWCSKLPSSAESLCPLTSPKHGPFYSPNTTYLSNILTSLILYTTVLMPAFVKSMIHLLLITAPPFTPTQQLMTRLFLKSSNVAAISAHALVTKSKISVDLFSLPPSPRFGGAVNTGPCIHPLFIRLSMHVCMYHSLNLFRIVVRRTRQ